MIPFATCTHRLCARLAKHQQAGGVVRGNFVLPQVFGLRHVTKMPPPAAASQAADGEHKHTNRLAKEQSPYLLQHAHNPVDWYPWCDEAFEAAKNEDKPIFLSVGYATCHWCHVMEVESFESEETAAIMNKHFINIKVDREERPDVDRVYMTFVQATTGHGGWPMSVWLTPDLKPFYGGTYYPGKDQYGMPSFNTVLRRIAQLWSTKRNDLEEQASTVMEQLQDFTSSSPPDSPTAPAAAAVDSHRLLAAVQSCAKQLSRGFDSKSGGFGGPPKFPRPSEINLLLRAALEQGTSSSPSAALLLGMSLFTLQQMAAGGMYDQIGGGFHRYSVDEYWHVPHFEKMLYDNPQLALTYLDAFRLTLAEQRTSGSSSSGQATAAASASASAAAGSSSKLEDNKNLKDPRVYASVVRGILDYLRRDMTHPQGGIYSAEDADSLNSSTNKKSEGAFYVWSADEIVDVLGQQRATLFNEVYGIKSAGNCTLSPRSDPHAEFTGKNVLMKFKSPAEAAAAVAPYLSPDDGEDLLASCRRDLWTRRAARPRPALDDKVVTAWNGQAISAFALAARILAAEQPPPKPCFPVDAAAPETYLAAAVKIAEFARQNLWDESTGRLRRAFCKAPSAVEGFADDYALLISGLLDLYECGGGLHWLQWAMQLQETLDTLFWDKQGGYFQGSGNDPSIKLRLKEDYDGAEPAASSIAAANLIRLAALLPNGTSSIDTTAAAAAADQMGYNARADAVLSGFIDRLDQAAIAMPQMCVAGWLRAKMPLRQVIIAGAASDPATRALLDAAHAAPALDKAVILIDPSNADSTAFWKQHNPEAWKMVEAHFKRSSTAAAGGSTAETPAGAAAAADPTSFTPTAFVCQNFTCQAPTSSPEKVYELLMATAAKKGAVKLTPVKL